MKARSLTLALLVLLFAHFAFAAEKDKKDKKSKKSESAAAAPNSVVDSGSFGIFINGRRVATEVFSIEQRSGMNFTKAEIQLAGGGNVQSSTMELLPNGNLHRYEWKETHPIQMGSIVEPSDQFLVQRYITGTGETPEKVRSTTHLLPPSTVILDDNFFSHRQLLLWRYLGASCGGVAAGECKLPPTQYGVLIPTQHTSASINMEYVGPDKVNVRGAERDLSRFRLTSEGDEWLLWLDQAHKVVRIVVASANTEVLRD